MQMCPLSFNNHSLMISCSHALVLSYSHALMLTCYHALMLACCSRIQMCSSCLSSLKGYSCGVRRQSNFSRFCVPTALFGITTEVRVCLSMTRSSRRSGSRSSRHSMRSRRDVGRHSRGCIPSPCLYSHRSAKGQIRTKKLLLYY